MKKQNWDAVQEATEFERPVPGAYIIKIVRVEDNEEKEYLKIEYDFAEGQFKGYYKDLFEAKDFWGGSFIRSYKEKALPFFKAFKTCLEASNRGYFFDEEHLDDMRGKVLGIVLGEEEYKKNDGTVGKRLYVNQVRTVKAIQDGDFKIPELKKMDSATSPVPSGGTGGFAELNDDDGELPF